MTTFSRLTHKSRILHQMGTELNFVKYNKMDYVSARERDDHICMYFKNNTKSCTDFA